MRTRSRLLITLTAVVTCVGCDQVSKHFAKSMLAFSGPQSFLADLLRLHYAENPGVAFSLGAQLPGHIRTALFIFGSGICLALLLAYILRAENRTIAQLLALNLIFAGGAGNLIDRIFRDGRVIDFLNLGIGEYRTAIFNVADLAITTGMLLLITATVLSPKPPPADAGAPQL